ncbi:nicotinate-nucleotide adenylyltransferase [Thiogranum longum]|uniref:Probable nicotinate-nucleotide adenylyltransferase n=1 Tax=Thiogranum longum TaxID=1537524 RepID=A0A4R1HDZ9_9GAMM|nr:nicotinate-nucleotide adenylyltransferase [Thiogranum longum]TCK17539.1 nicotinate-nucleotide adenylyltransferase [Thiogranum longum]
MICILGGTFDPVHFGHLRTALDVQQALAIPRLHLLPCRIPPHRPEPQLSAAMRLELLQLGIQNEPALQVDTRELKREGPSWMVDTLHSLRDDIGTDEPLCLALGMDALHGLSGWHRWHDITGLCHLVVMQRPGNDWPVSGEIADWLQGARVNDVAALHGTSAGRVAAVAVRQLEISSTDIRALLAAGKNARYLLPEAVLERITQENWYAN